MNVEVFSVALDEQINLTLINHLVREDSQEDLCFALFQPSTGLTRFTSIISKVLLPAIDEREVHGNVSFYPQYFERVIEEAVKTGMGVAFIHSHPLGQSWQGMSLDDTNAEADMAASIFAATGFPLVGLTIAGISRVWSARHWIKNKEKRWQRKDCENVRVVGEKLTVSFCPTLKEEPTFPESLRTTVSAWGSKIQGDLSRLRVGVVGLGSVGSLVSECLARTGFSDVKLIDFDIIKEHNLDRTLHAYKEHVEISKLKVDIACEAAKKSAVMANFQVSSVKQGIQNEAAYKTALDCDVLFCCVDKPWGRSILNFLSYSHLIPIIDGGISATRKPNGTLRTAEWGVHVVGPGRKCLECIGQYSSGDVAMERDGLLEDAEYIHSLPDESPLKKSENVFIFSMSLAAREVLALVQLIGKISEVPAPNKERYIFPASHIEQENIGACAENCYFRSINSKGDNGGHPGTE